MNKKIGDNIKKYRELKKTESGKFTQKKLADAVGMSLRMIQNYEYGDTTPSIETLKKIAQALEVDLTDLLKFEGSPYLMDHVEYRIDDFLNEKAFEIFEKIYNEKNIEKETGLTALEFYNKDRYLSESLIKALEKIIESNLETYKKRVLNKENTPRMGTLKIKYPPGEVKNVKDVYTLGEKENDVKYLEYYLNRYAKLLSKAVLNNDREMKNKDKYLAYYDNLADDLEEVFINTFKVEVLGEELIEDHVWNDYESRNKEKIKKDLDEVPIEKLGFSGRKDFRKLEEHDEYQQKKWLKEKGLKEKDD